MENVRIAYARFRMKYRPAKKLTPEVIAKVKAEAEKIRELYGSL